VIININILKLYSEDKKILKINKFAPQNSNFFYKVNKFAAQIFKFIAKSRL